MARWPFRRRCGRIWTAWPRSAENRASSTGGYRRSRSAARHDDDSRGRGGQGAVEGMMWAAIAIGGALGSMLRHGVNMTVHRLTGQVVPSAVAAVNISGCLVVGVLAGMIASGRWDPNQTV